METVKTVIQIYIRKGKKIKQFCSDRCRWVIGTIKQSRNIKERYLNCIKDCPLNIEKDLTKEG